MTRLNLQPKKKTLKKFFKPKYYEDRNCCWIIQQKNFNLEAFSEKLVQILNKKTQIWLKKLI